MRHSLYSLTLVLVILCWSLISESVTKAEDVICLNDGLLVADRCFCPPNLLGDRCQMPRCPQEEGDLCLVHPTSMCVFDFFKYGVCPIKCGICPTVPSSSTTTATTTSTTSTTTTSTTSTITTSTTSTTPSTITTSTTTSTPSTTTTSTTTSTPSTTTTSTPSTTTTSTPSTTTTSTTTSTPTTATTSNTTVFPCSIAPHVPNSDVILTNYTATYKCKEGFVKLGTNSVSTCEDNVWSDINLQCADVSTCYVMDGAIRAYRGNQSTTTLGYTCQVWASRYPISHTYNLYHFLRVAGSDFTPSIEEHKNYCRDPSGYGRPPLGRLWCYVTDPSKRWDYCDDVPPC